MRSLLFVPGDSERKLEKSLSSEADVLLIDLEDSVSLDAKPAARKCAAEFMADQDGKTGPQLFIRINALSTGLADEDLAAVMSARPAGILLPKAEAPADIEHLAAKLNVHEAEIGIEEGATRIIALITETAKGVLAATGYRRPLPRLAGLTWGAEDLSADLGARTARDENGRYTDVFRLARALTLLAATGSEVPAIDTVFVNFRDDEGLRKECLEAERDGFVAKMAIHPAQVPIINEAFTPSAEAVAKAQAIVDAFEAAGNPGVVGIDGEMLDRPHLLRARRLLDRAGDAEIN
jgi:citrate lyase subunit beta/citryl-CoA lyase